MNKKIKPLIIITIFLLAVVMPFVKVDAVTHVVYIISPAQDESFSYTTTNVVFSGWSSTTGLTPNTEYRCLYEWHVDSVYVFGLSRYQYSSSSGLLGVIDLDYTVDVLTYSVGEHNTTLEVNIYLASEPHVSIADDSDTHDWSRDEALPPIPPSVEFTNPENPGGSYDYSTSTLYNCEWTVSDDDGYVATMNFYVDDILKFEFGSQPQGDYSYEVTMGTDKTYYLKVDGTDGESNSYSETTSVIAYNASQYVDVNLPLGQYHNSEIAFQIENGAPDGLHNMSYSVEDYAWFDENITSNNADVFMDTTWDYEYGLLSWSQYIYGVDIDYGDRIQSSGDWLHYKDITLTNPTATTVTNLPICISVTWEDSMQADFDDVTFFDTAGTTMLDFERAEYTASTSAIYYVEIPSLIGSGTYVTKMLYGDAGASYLGDQQGTYKDNGIDLVMHLDDTTDSSSNSYDFTDVGSNTFESGKVGNCVDYGGSQDYLHRTDDSAELDAFDLTWTISFWMKPEQQTDFYSVFMMDVANMGFMAYTTTGGDRMYVYQPGGVFGNFADLWNLNWVHLAVTGNSSGMFFYVDGAYITKNVNTLDWDEPNEDYFMGVYFDGSNHDAVGDTDELFLVDKDWTEAEVGCFYDFQASQTNVATGAETVNAQVNNSIIVSASYDTGVSTKGTDYVINFEATATCTVEWINITLMIYETIFVVYSTSALIAQTNSFTFNDSAWASLSDGWFSMNLSLFDDLDSYFTTNLTYYKDTVAPTVNLQSPENRTTSDPYSNLQIIPLSYSIEEDGEVVSWDNDMKSLTIDGETFTGDQWDVYPKHKPLIFYEGLHTLNLTAWDEAGNQGKESVSFYYEERLDKPLELTFTSSIDDETINPEQYLSIYLDGIPIPSTTTTNLNEFTVTVYDKFGILLNSTSYNYTSVINMELPLRPVVFENNNEIICKYWISHNLFEKSFWISAGNNQTYYLNDTTYNLVAEAGDEYYNETHWYGQTYISFTVVSGMGTIEVTLDLISDDPLYQPLRITLYEKGFDIGFIYVTYETSWGNTSIRVMDNSSWLGSEIFGEGISIWLFPTNYGLHNISIIIYHDGTEYFTDVFSFTIQEPMPEPDNYYILLNPPSYDIDAGLIYIDLCTYYGNCTYRVMMNESWLGSNVSEGSSVWECDFSSAGFYNFTVFVYQGATVWSTLTSSITIPEPTPEEDNFYIILNPPSYDIEAGLLYIDIITYWENQTIRVSMNDTWLGEAVPEGSSVWSFDSSQSGFYNFSCYVYNGQEVWEIITTSITIPDLTIEIYTVHFDLATISGVGLPFETAKIFVNNSRIYSSEQYYFENTILDISVRDFYNNLLYNTTVQVTDNLDVSLTVKLIGQHIKNDYVIAAKIFLISTDDSNYNHSYIIAAHSSITVLLFANSYHIRVIPLQIEINNETHIITYYATSSSYQDLGYDTQTYTISMETDLEPLDLEEPKEVRTWPAWVIAAGAIFINAILISFIGAMGKWGIVKIWNYGLYYPNKGANWILRKFRSEKEFHWCVEHKGGLEFVTPEQHKKAEVLKKEGQF